MTKLYLSLFILVASLAYIQGNGDAATEDLQCYKCTGTSEYCRDKFDEDAAKDAGNAVETCSTGKTQCYKLGEDEAIVRKCGTADNCKEEGAFCCDGKLCNSGPISIGSSFLILGAIIFTTFGIWWH